MMTQHISVITLGISDLERSKTFYGRGFGWRPVFENDEIDFYQMNGLVFGTWKAPALEADMQRQNTVSAGAYALAHNVGRDEVEPLMAKLAAAGGRVLRAADAPPHGGFRGYVADPDGHPWEIAWNPAWTTNADGHVTFGV